METDCETLRVIRRNLTVLASHTTLMPAGICGRAQKRATLVSLDSPCTLVSSPCVSPSKINRIKCKKSILSILPLAPITKKIYAFPNPRVLCRINLIPSNDLFHIPLEP